MAGLDSRGVMDGAAVGFGLMDRYLQREHTQELQEDQNDRAERRFDMTEERFDMAQQDAGRKRDQEQAQFVLGKVAQGMDITEDEYQFLEKNPQYWPALDARTDKSIETAQAVIDPENPTGPNDPEVLEAMNQLWGYRINRGDGGKKRIAGLYPGPRGDTVALELEVEKEDGNKYTAPMTRNRSTADDDPVLETPVEALVNQVQGYRLLRNAFKSPEAQAQANKLLTALTGKEAKKTKPVVVNNRLVDPDTGTLIADYSDDKDASSPAAKKYRELIAMNVPEAEARRAAYGLKSQTNKPLVVNNQLVDPVSGEVLGDYRDAPGSSSKLPADVQTAEWLVSKGIAGDANAAWNMMSMARSDPSRFVASYVTQALKSQEMMMPEEQKTQPELVEEATQMYQRIMASARQGGDASAEPPAPTRPAGLEMTDSNVQVLPEDGSAVQQADGSYAGRVNRSAGINPQPRPANGARTPEQVRTDFKNGKISKRQAVAELQTMGFE